MDELGIESELIILTKGTIDKFLEYENASDLIALYTFYYYTAKWQKTNQPKAVDKYVMQGLHWGDRRFLNAKEILEKLELITQVINRNEKGRITGHYIKLNYIMKSVNLPTHVENQEWTEPVGGFSGTNALSTNNINALSTNKLNTLTPTVKKTSKVTTSDEDKGKIQYVFAYVKTINPAVMSVVAHKAQRDACVSLVDTYGPDAIKARIEAYKGIRDQEYVPTISTPFDLWTKWTKLDKYVKLSEPMSVGFKLNNL